MSQVLSSQQLNRSSHSAKRQQVIKGVALWVIQALLALTFLFTGSMKLITPFEILAHQMPVQLPALFVHFIGTAEVAGALGMILPGLLRIQRFLTPLAACGLLIIMVGATVISLLVGMVAPALATLVLGLLAATVVCGRRSWASA